MTEPNEQTPDPVAPDPVDDPGALAPEQENEAELPEWAKEKLRKVNREAQNLRTRLKEVEPLAQEAQQKRDAEKTEVQRATERAQALEQQLAQQQQLAETLTYANRYGIPETHHRYIVGSSPEEREDAAKGIADMLKAAAAPPITPPPTNRPTANLRPGASPATQDTGAPTAYPPEWIPRNKQPRTSG